VEDTPAIATLDLRKTYGSVEALRGLTLEVPRGSIHGFLGRNGAGKTTTIKILLGMTRPSGGSARVLGRSADDPRASVEIRRRVGFVSEDKRLYDAMTTDEMLRFTASAYPAWRADLQQHYVRTFELRPGARVRTLSRGVRTLLALTLALCRGAELLMLDEPTSGLDPAMVEAVLQALVRHVAREESTIFFSSHQIAEVEQIADSLAIVHRGRVRAAGELDELLGRYRRLQLVFAGEAPPGFSAPGILRTRREGRTLTVFSSVGSDGLLDAARALGPVSVDVAPLNLKEIFLETVGTED